MHDTLLIYFLYDARYGFAYSVKNVGGYFKNISVTSRISQLLQEYLSYFKNSYHKFKMSDIRIVGKYLLFNEKL
jgi:hypothetical protein